MFVIEMKPEPQTIPMPASTIRALRRALGLTQFQLGRALYLEGPHPDRVVRRWESGAPMSGPARKALEMMAEKARIDLTSLSETTETQHIR